MTMDTTIKIEITAFDSSATTIHRVTLESDAPPHECVARIAGMLRKHLEAEQATESQALATEFASRPASYREQLAAVTGLDPCELDVDESEAPPPSASQDLDTDAAAAHVVIEWAGVCTDPAKLRRAIEREQARATASPRKAVRSSVIAACEARLCELNGAQA